MSETAFIRGTVVHGKHLGHTIGFPTANVEPEAGASIPHIGVYAGEILISSETKRRRCLINHGFQPTLPSGKETIEVYIVDFDSDIYGASVCLWLHTYLRAEQKFDSIESLKAQLARDVERLRGSAP